MKTMIYCRTEEKGIQTFYVLVEGRSYFLFRQDYRKSVKEYFAKGVDVQKIGSYNGVHSSAVQRTLDKLPAHIRYIEKEYGVEIYDNTKERKAKKKQACKREKFYWQTIDWDIA